jgi:hypothetical protein
MQLASRKVFPKKGIGALMETVIDIIILLFVCLLGQGILQKMPNARGHLFFSAGIWAESGFGAAKRELRN